MIQRGGEERELITGMDIQRLNLLRPAGWLPGWQEARREQRNFSIARCDHGMTEGGKDSSSDGVKQASWSWSWSCKWEAGRAFDGELEEEKETETREREEKLELHREWAPSSLASVLWC